MNKVYCNTCLFFHHFQKRDNFSDFLFGYLGDETFQKVLALNPVALRTDKTLQSFVHSECNRVNLSAKICFKKSKYFP